MRAVSRGRVERVVKPVDGLVDGRNRPVKPVDGGVDERNRPVKPVDGPVGERDRVVKPVDWGVDERDRGVKHADRGVGHAHRRVGVRGSAVGMLPRRVRRAASPAADANRAVGGAAGAARVEILQVRGFRSSDATPPQDLTTRCSPFFIPLAPAAARLGAGVALPSRRRRELSSLTPHRLRRRTRSPLHSLAFLYFTI